MILGLRVPYFHMARLLPPPTYLAYAGLFGLFAFGAYRSRHRNSSVLYCVAAIFPFIYALSSQTDHDADPRYAIVLSPVLALLIAQLLGKWSWAALGLALAVTVSFVNLHEMEGVSQQGAVAPRNLTPLISKLDSLGLDHVYADYYAAYVLDFDTHERITAVESKFQSVAFVDGQAVIPDDPTVKWAPYQREVKASRHGFVLFRGGIGAARIAAQLEQHGFRRYAVGRFLIYVPPAT